MMNFDSLGFRKSVQNLNFKLQIPEIDMYVRVLHIRIRIKSGIVNTYDVHVGSYSRWYKHCILNSRSVAVLDCHACAAWYM